MKRKGKVASKSNVIQKEAQSNECAYCGISLAKDDLQALFVEEEIGRLFCSEGCIVSHFSPEIERLERDYFRGLTKHDLSDPERSKMSHLRWKTLEAPHEIWREKTLQGDFRYTLIREFTYQGKPLWSVSVTLMLRGEPSFLFIAFVTINSKLVEKFRRGERVQWLNPASKHAESLDHPDVEEVILNEFTDDDMTNTAITEFDLDMDDTVSDYDGLAEPFTEDERFRAEVSTMRSQEDIQPGEFVEYESCIEETLQGPDEIWSFQPDKKSRSNKLYHFMRHYAEDSDSMWYIIIARETDDEEHLEIVDAFPTRDPLLVDHFRRGSQELGEDGFGGVKVSGPVEGGGNDSDSGGRVLH